MLRRRIKAWSTYTIDSDGVVRWGSEVQPVMRDRKGEYVMLGRTTKGGRISNERYKRYVADLMGQTFPDVEPEEWRVIEEFPKYEMNRDGVVRHRVNLTKNRLRTNQHGSLQIALWQEGVTSPRTRSLGLLYKKTWGTNCPRVSI